MNVNTAQNDTGVVKGEFRQCTLVRYDKGVVNTVTYIPLRWAKVGRDVTIKDGDGDWIIWNILYVNQNIVTDPVDSKTLIKSHRRATGDSMPRKTSKDS
jgi:hypothetical protein